MTQMGQQASGKVKVSFSQGLKMIGPYVKDRLLEQVKAVWLIITYLFLFQTSGSLVSTQSTPLVHNWGILFHLRLESHLFLQRLECLDWDDGFLRVDRL